MSIREMGAAGMLKNLTEPVRDPSYAIRNESDVAFFEWLLISDADYCMSSTVSTFSMTSFLRSNCHVLDTMKGASCADGITAPQPRAMEPALFRRNIQLDRYFLVNKTCDATCEEIAWRRVKVVKVPATNSSSANRKRELCSVVGDASTLVKAYYAKTW